MTDRWAFMRHQKYPIHFFTKEYKISVFVAIFLAIDELAFSCIGTYLLQDDWSS